MKNQQIDAIIAGTLVDGTGAKAVKNKAILIDGYTIKDVVDPDAVDFTKLGNVIDASNRVVVPGFNDEHTHYLAMGVRLGHLQLADAESIDDIVNGLEGYIKEKGKGDGDWVQGSGWDESTFTYGQKRYPNRWDLDKVSPNNPVALTRICGHMVVLNSRALEECHISKDTPQPPGGKVDKDKNTSEPTGVLRDARDLVIPYIPAPSYNELRQGLRDAAALAHSIGVTSIHDASRPIKKETIPYVDAHKEGDLNIRAHVMTNFGYLKERSGDEWLNFGTLKLGIDGSLGAETALVIENYENSDHNGILRVSLEETNEHAKRAHDRGMVVGIHAIGDRAIDYALRSLDTERDRIIHFEYPTDEHIKFVKKHGIIASMQPNFVKWAVPGGMYETRLGKERNKRSNPYRRLIDDGIVVAFGSDGMPFNPMFGVLCALNHPIPESRITAEEAIKCYTLNGAYASFEEDIKGSIEPGKLADIAILSYDPLSDDATSYDMRKTDPKQILAAVDGVVEMTVLGGKIVYERA